MEGKMSDLGLAVVSVKVPCTPANLGVFARQFGWTRLAKIIRVNRTGLMRSFSSKGNPRMRTVFAAVDAMNLKLTLDEIKNGGQDEPRI
jgi:hypothetical protein